MTTSSTPSSPKRKLLPFLLSGCGLLALCVLAACAADAVYWTFRNRGAARELSAAELQTEVASLPPGDAARGEQIFTTEQACHACHLEAAIGPSFTGEPPLATRAATRKPGYAAEAYLYESIINPKAYVVPGYQGDIMPENFGVILDQQSLADLVAYLLTMQ
jgi:mono/diheme cytochrome c family protein